MVVCLVAFHWRAYGDFVGRFFSFDDFMVLGQANRFRILGPTDLWHFFEGQQGFALYRPFTTVGYFWVQQALWGLDPRGWMLTHLAVHVLNGLLVGAIAGRLLGSRASMLAAALVYASAPGHTLAARWFAFFTITGTALVYFLGLWLWLSVRSRWRVPVTFTAFLVGLLCSEHAVTFPLAVTLVAVLGQRRGLLESARELLPLHVLAGAYVAAKLVYLRVIFPRIDPVAAGYYAHFYPISFAPMAMLDALGRYASGTVSFLFTADLPEAYYRILGGFVVGLAVVTTIAALRRDAGPSLRGVACGVDLFVVALGPILVLPQRIWVAYVGIPALGAALAIASAPRGIRGGKGLALLIATLLVWHSVQRASPLARGDVHFVYVEGSATLAASWLSTLRRVAEDTPSVREFVVPLDGQTQRLFVQGAAHRLFLCAPYDVRPVARPAQEPQAPGRMVLLKPNPLPPEVPADGWRAVRACSG